jgi:hypothetical protein
LQHEQLEEKIMPNAVFRFMTVRPPQRKDMAEDDAVSGLQLILAYLSSRPTMSCKCAVRQHPRPEIM